MSVFVLCRAESCRVVCLGETRRPLQKKGRDQNSHQRKIRGTRLIIHVKRLEATHSQTRTSVASLHDSGSQFRKSSQKPSKAILGRRQAIHELPPPIPIPLFPASRWFLRSERLQGPPEENPSYLIFQGQTTNKPTTSLAAPRKPRRLGPSILPADPIC